MLILLHSKADILNLDIIISTFQATWTLISQRKIDIRWQKSRQTLNRIQFIFIRWVTMWSKLRAPNFTPNKEPCYFEVKQFVFFVRKHGENKIKWDEMMAPENRSFTLNETLISSFSSVHFYFSPRLILYKKLILFLSYLFYWPLSFFRICEVARVVKYQLIKPRRNMVACPL